MTNAEDAEAKRGVREGEQGREGLSGSGAPTAIRGHTRTVLLFASFADSSAPFAFGLWPRPGRYSSIVWLRSGPTLIRLMGTPTNSSIRSR